MSPLAHSSIILPFPALSPPPQRSQKNPQTSSQFYRVYTLRSLLISYLPSCKVIKAPSKQGEWMYRKQSTL